MKSKICDGPFAVLFSSVLRNNLPVFHDKSHSIDWKNNYQGYWEYHIPEMVRMWSFPWIFYFTVQCNSVNRKISNLKWTNKIIKNCHKGFYILVSPPRSKKLPFFPDRSAVPLQLIIKNMQNREVDGRQVLKLRQVGHFKIFESFFTPFHQFKLYSEVTIYNWIVKWSLTVTRLLWSNSNSCTQSSWFLFRWQTEVNFFQTIQFSRNLHWLYLV